MYILSSLGRPVSTTWKYVVLQLPQRFKYINITVDWHFSPNKNSKKAFQHAIGIPIINMIVIWISFILQR